MNYDLYQSSSREAFANNYPYLRRPGPIELDAARDVPSLFQENAAAISAVTSGQIFPYIVQLLADISIEQEAQGNFVNARYNNGNRAEIGSRPSGLVAANESLRTVPTTSNQHHNDVSDFISKNLNNLYNRNDVSMEGLTHEAIVRAEQVTEEFGLGPEFTPQLIKLALYDFVILCGRHPTSYSSVEVLSAMANIVIDDSSSMNTGNRIRALQETLQAVAEFATILEPTGISIRFLNFERDKGFDNLTDVNEVVRKAQMVHYDGNTRLGQMLQQKVVNPILRKANSNVLKKPVIVAVITDGEVSPTLEFWRNSMETPYFTDISILVDLW